MTTLSNTQAAPQSKSSSDLHAQRLLYSRAEVAFQLSTSLRNIAYRIAAGTLKIRRQGGRVLITHAELIRQSNLNDNTPMVPAKKPSASGQVIPMQTNKAA